MTSTRSSDTLSLPLYRIAQARSGDKGDTSDISIFFTSRELFEACESQLSADRVKDFLSPLVHGDVVRYEMPKMYALKFVCEQALGGGGSSSLRSDNLGKATGSALLRFVVDDVPTSLAEASPLFHGPTSRSSS